MSPCDGEGGWECGGISGIGGYWRWRIRVVLPMGGFYLYFGFGGGGIISNHLDPVPRGRGGCRNV